MYNVFSYVRTRTHTRTYAHKLTELKQTHTIQTNIIQTTHTHTHTHTHTLTHSLTHMTSTY